MIVRKIYNNDLDERLKYLNFSGAYSIINNNTTGIYNYTITKNGFIYFLGSSGSVSVTPELTLFINDLSVFTYRLGYTSSYQKITSGIYPVKVGDIVKLSITISFSTTTSVYFIPYS